MAQWDPAMGLGSGLGTAGGLSSMGWLTGGAGATGLSAFSPLGWGLIGASALAGGLKKKKTQDIPWGQWVAHPEYPETPGRMKEMSNYTTETIGAAREGKEVPWITKYFDGAPGSGMGITQGVQDQLRQTTFGSGSQQGTADIAAQTGAITGVGPKATQANVNKTMLDYQNKSAAINTEIAKIRAGMQGGVLGQALQAGIQMPRGPEGEVIGGGGMGGGGGGMSGADTMGGINNTLMRLGEIGAFDGMFGNKAAAGNSTVMQGFDPNTMSTMPAGYYPSPMPNNYSMPPQSLSQHIANPPSEMGYVSNYIAGNIAKGANMIPGWRDAANTVGRSVKGLKKLWPNYLNWAVRQPWAR